MKSYESNFSYLKNTKLSIYYDDLRTAEYASENFSNLTKIILRRIYKIYGTRKWYGYKHGCWCSCKEYKG